ncbi:DUF2147 domain-containing protein [Roseovarius aestuariivivens]|uniref:DUF2147 domain-containing protein n=1 Tax=Roseovarius aestuariivivens TaxID=1888910 RepID=UPI00108166ED|nr:DUF2147 domain-containing protein [Roseovarius aestuariivivens]
MKTPVLAALAVLMSAGIALAADPLEGYWRTAKDDNGNSGLVHVKPCGGGLCGTLVKAYNGQGQEIASDNIGRQIISQTKANGGGAYSGKVYSPDRGKTYNSKLQMQGNLLKVSGCVLGICRDGGTWQKVK